MTANRFDGLMGGLKGKQSKKAEPTAQPSEKPVAPLAKSKDPNYTRATVYLTSELHTRMKVAAAQQGMELSDMAEQAIDDWLSKHSGD